MSMKPNIPRFPHGAETPYSRPAVTGGALFPVVMDGRIAENAGKYARGAVLYAFEAVGGADALADWARDNETDFYTKLFPKIITKEVEVSDKRGVDELLDALDGEYEVMQEISVGSAHGTDGFPPQGDSRPVGSTPPGHTGTPPGHVEREYVPYDLDAMLDENDAVTDGYDLDDLVEFTSE